MILKWNCTFIIKILEIFKFYAQILIAHSSSVLWNIGLHFSFKCPKRYILWYQFLKLDKSANIMMSIFSGCRTKSDFFTACSVQGGWNFFCSKIILRAQKNPMNFLLFLEKWTNFLFPRVFSHISYSKIDWILHISGGGRGIFLKKI